MDAEGTDVKVIHYIQRRMHALFERARLSKVYSNYDDLNYL